MSVKNLLVRYNGILGERVAERQLGMRTWVGDCIDSKSRLRNCMVVLGMSIAAQNRLLIADLEEMRMDKETKAESKWFSESQ